MRKLLNSPWFVAVLALAALLFVGRAVFSTPSSPAPGAPVMESTDETPSPAGEDGAEGAPRLSLAGALKTLVIPAAARDPFALPVRTDAADPEPGSVVMVEVVDRLRLSAIWVQGPAVFLLLNGRICQPGDTIDRFTVETAAIDGAWIGHLGGRSFLPVGQELAVPSFVPGSTTPLSK